MTNAKTSKYFIHYNPNPLQKETGDCLIRALCKITGVSWVSMYIELSDLGRENCTPFTALNMDYLFVDFYEFKKHKVSRQKGRKALNVEAFCKEHPKGKYILRLAHHVIAVVDGRYYDLYPCWDKKTVYTYYEYPANKWGKSND